MTWQEIKQVIKELKHTKWTDRELKEVFKRSADMHRKIYIAKQLRDKQDIIDIKNFS